MIKIKFSKWLRISRENYFQRGAWIELVYGAKLVNVFRQNRSVEKTTSASWTVGVCWLCMVLRLTSTQFDIQTAARTYYQRYEPFVEQTLKVQTTIKLASFKYLSAPIQTHLPTAYLCIRCFSRQRASWSPTPLSTNQKCTWTVRGSSDKTNCG